MASVTVSVDSVDSVDSVGCRPSTETTESTESTETKKMEIPWRDGGRTIAENSQMLCREDNRRKGAK